MELDYVPKYGAEGARLSSEISNIEGARLSSEISNTRTDLTS